MKYGLVGTIAGLIEALGILQMIFGAVSSFSPGLILQFLEMIAASARAVLRPLVEIDDELRWIWEITDLMLAAMVGIVRFGLITNPGGFDAIDDFECMEWLRINGASDEALKSAMIRGLYDLAFAFEDGDVSLRDCGRPRNPRFAKDAIHLPRLNFLEDACRHGRHRLRTLLRGVEEPRRSFEFFHRLENVKMADSTGLKREERGYVEALQFDVQANIKHDREYQPLIDVRGLPCWPSLPDYDQLVEGDRLKTEQRDFESHWDHRRVGTKTLKVMKDFDCVVLGVGLGAIPYVCNELVSHDHRWHDLVTHCKTSATQSFQLWMREDVETLGWRRDQCTVTGFVDPFDTWADMRHLLTEETWRIPPRAIAYFCAVLPDSEPPPKRSDRHYPSRCRDQVRQNAIRFLNRHVRHLWPHAVQRNKFRWDMLMDPANPRRETSNQSAFDTQFWTANVNPSDRYCLTLPGTVRYRISPLDNTYDNLTVVGDWTACGFNQGCVEAAVMSGRLGAHAISGFPRLENIIGYDHP